MSDTNRPLKTDLELLQWGNDLLRRAEELHVHAGNWPLWHERVLEWRAEFRANQERALAARAAAVRQDETVDRLVIAGVPFKFILDESMPPDEIEIRGPNGSRRMKFGIPIQPLETTGSHFKPGDRV